MRIETDVLSKVIRYERERAGITASQMAKHLGCSPGYIYHLENDLSRPSKTLLAKFTKVVKLDPKQLRAQVVKGITEQLAEMGI